MHRYKKAFIATIANFLNETESEISKLVKIPEPDRGDLSLPCFPFAGKLKKNPAQIAKEICSAFEDDMLFFKTEAAGPYVNAFINPEHIMKTLIPEIRKAGKLFAHSFMGKGKTVVIDFSSPNIAKPLGFHHLRSTMIGNSLRLIHQALGYKVEGINFLGDWGKTFGLLAAIFKQKGDRTRLEKEGISYLLELYIDANRKKESDSEFDEEARKMFKKQEEGDKEAMALWTLFKEISLKEFKRIYKRLNVTFDHFEGESFYKDGMDDIIKWVSDTVGTRIDDGALVVDMPYGENEPPMMLKKSDGATLYATRDIAAAKDRYDRFAFDKSLYVVGAEQKRHFEQLKRALSSMGCKWEKDIQHVSFGRIHGMSTRKGNVVFLEEVLDEAKERAFKKMKADSGKRDMDLHAVAEQVGIGGIVFGDLKNLRTSDYTFNFDDILNTKGFTGICVQYAHARCCSILKKGAEDGFLTEDADLSLLTASEEITLIKDIGKIPDAVKAAAADLEPSRLARVLYDAARTWNRYQQAGNSNSSLRILTGDKNLTAARLALVDAVKTALAKGLELLGVAAPEAM
jgi:arginyl-tRNA synthetase